MDKDAEAFRTISEVGEDLDLPQHVLRFWETRFPQIRPVKRGGGRRYYRPEDCDLLRGIKHLLYGEGYTIKGVQRILKEEGPRTVQAVGRAGALHGSSARKQSSPAFQEPIITAAKDGDDIALVSPLTRREPLLPKAGLDRDGGAKDTPSRSSLEPHVDPRPSAKAQDTAVAGEKRHIEPIVAPIGSERRQPRVDPSAPALPGFEPVAVSTGAQRKVKPKQLALFEGLEEEGLSSKDREALRQVLEKIAECRKLIAAADIMETVTPNFADL